MTAPGSMPVVIQAHGRPDSQTIVTVALHSDLRHWLDQGYEFPRARIIPGTFGYQFAPLQQARES